MARKYIPVLVGNTSGKIYLDDIHKVHQILRKVTATIPSFNKKRLRKKTTIATEAESIEKDN